jgi:hypothetical protein
VLVGRIQVSSEYQLLDKSISPVRGELLPHLLYWLPPVPPCVFLSLILLQGFIFIPLLNPYFCCKKELQINFLTGPHLAVVLGIEFRHPTAPSNLNACIRLLLTRRQLSPSSGVVDMGRLWHTGELLLGAQEAGACREGAIGKGAAGRAMGVQGAASWDRRRAQSRARARRRTPRKLPRGGRR